MVSSIFIAMTAAELQGAGPMPPRTAYMACHFSPYGRGLSNLPVSLPDGCMLILNDRIPICGHDPATVAEQLEQVVTEQKCSCLLLDLQRPGSEETRQVCRAISQRLTCPVGISEHYIGDLPVAVFLSPVPPCRTVAEHLAPWQGREVWLEAALEHWQISVTEEGSQTQLLPYCAPPDGAFADEQLHCHYHQQVFDDRAEFFLYRTQEDVQALLKEGEALGVTKAVGLWQQWKQDDRQLDSSDCGQ